MYHSIRPALHPSGMKHPLHQTLIFVCLGFFLNPLSSRSCRLEQRENSPPGCSFVFENATFNLYGKIRSIRMECDGTAVENLTDYEPRHHGEAVPGGAALAGSGR